MSTVARHYRDTAIAESKKAEDLLRKHPCTDINDLGRSLIVWDKHAPQLVMDDRRKFDAFLDMFQAVPQVYDRYMTYESSDGDVSYSEFRDLVSGMVRNIENRGGIVPMAPQTDDPNAKKRANNNRSKGDGKGRGAKDGGN